MVVKISITDLPINIIEIIVEECNQCTLVNLIRCNSFFFDLGVTKIYKRIYLSDSLAAESNIFKSNIYWSVLTAKEEELQRISKELENKNIHHREENIFNDEIFGGVKLRKLLNQKLENLMNSMKKKNYVNLVEELWIDQDLSHDLQNEFVGILVEKSKSIRRIGSILDRKIMETIYCIEKKEVKGSSENEHSNYSKTEESIKGNWHLLNNLELCSENYYIPGKISSEYLQKLKDIFFKVIESKNNVIDELSIFSNPLGIFNAFEMKESEKSKIHEKLKINSFIYHVREDKFQNNYNNFEKLSEIIDTEHLKSLTVICWLIDDTTNNRFKTFSRLIYEDFIHLEDVNLISMVVDEKVLCDFIQSLKNLKRFRFHHLTPGKFVNDSNSKLIQSLVKYQGHNLKYLDINFYRGENQLYWYNYFESKVEVNEDCCDCETCREVKNVILPRKIFFKEGMNGDEEYDNRDIIRLIFRKGLIPYTFSFDKYPSFLNRIKVEVFIRKFNELNGTQIDAEDFKRVFEAMVHHQMRYGSQFFVSNFPYLEKLVVNDIPFIVNKEKTEPGKSGINGIQMVFPFDDLL